MSDSNIFYPEGIEIEVMNEKFRIKPFVLKTRTKFLNVVVDVFKEAMNQGENPDEITNKMSVAVKFITVAGERIKEIYVMLLDRNEEFLNDNMTLADEVKVVKTVFEVNDFAFLVAEIQELVQKTQTKTA